MLFFISLGSRAIYFGSKTNFIVGCKDSVKRISFYQGGRFESTDTGYDPSFRDWAV